GSAPLRLGAQTSPRAALRLSDATNRLAGRAKKTNSRRRCKRSAEPTTRQGVCAAWLRIVADQKAEAKRQPGSPTHAAFASVGVGQRSVNRAQHAVPAGSRGYFNQGTQDANQTAPEGTFAVFLFGTLNGPVNHHGPAHNRLAIDEAPVAAVPAVVPIVSHGEIVAGRNHDFSILNVLENLIGPFRLHAGN